MAPPEPGLSRASGELPLGKLPPELLRRVLGRSPEPPAELLVGPAVGEDACAIALPAGVLVAATDPITLAGRAMGRHVVLVNANDVAATGVRPRWFLMTALFPPGTTESDVEALFAEVSLALEEVGAALVGGHSELSFSVTRTVVVGEMLGTAEEGAFVSTSGARPGDVLVQIGTAPVEGAALLAREGGRALDALDPATVRAAAAGLESPGISVVEGALLAARLGASSMHDATEGGLAGALNELAAASGVRLLVDSSELLLFEPGIEVLRALGADPMATLASGALLATFSPSRATGAVERLREAGHAVAAIGAAESGAGVVDARSGPLAWPERDELSRLLR